MPSLVLLSPAPGAGKTTVAAAIVQKMHSDGPIVAVSRLGEDGNAAADAALFSRLGGAGDVEVLEAVGGDAAAAPDARAVVVGDGGGAVSDVVAFCRSAGARLAGVVLNRVPAKRRSRLLQELEGQGLSSLLDIPEDRSLAAPSLGQVVMALNAETMFFDSNGERPLDRLLIAPISADPGQYYFARNEVNAVIVRSDKPDLQLAALNAGATCLIVTGELPLLGYVTERAESDEIAIIRTRKETVDAVQSIEAIYGSGAFSGSPAKLSRLAELTRDFDVSQLFGA